VALIVTMLLSLLAHGDIIIMEPSTIWENPKAVILDATVTGFVEGGHARLKVHEALRGNVDETVICREAVLDCVSPLVYCKDLLKVGQRYILFMGGLTIHSDGAWYWPIKERADGAIVCHFRRPRGYSTPRLEEIPEPRLPLRRWSRSLLDSRTECVRCRKGFWRRGPSCGLS